MTQLSLSDKQIDIEIMRASKTSEYIRKQVPSGEVFTFGRALARAIEAALQQQPADNEVRALMDIAAERERQKSAEGWTPEHDDEHRDGSLAQAAACYASNAATWAEYGSRKLAGKYAPLSTGFRWPWAREWWKPKSQRRDLVRAGALILAEIERLDRAALRQYLKDHP